VKVGRSKPQRGSATMRDLRQFSGALARMLPTLLFSRDRDALRRWCAVRSWVDNAMDGNPCTDLPTLSLAVAYLARRAAAASAKRI
jgi:hypothetical protein